MQSIFRTRMQTTGGNCGISFQRTLPRKSSFVRQLWFSSFELLRSSRCTPPEKVTIDQPPAIGADFDGYQENCFGRCMSKILAAIKVVGKARFGVVREEDRSGARSGEDADAYRERPWTALAASTAQEEPIGIGT